MKYAVRSAAVALLFLTTSLALAQAMQMNPLRRAMAQRQNCVPTSRGRSKMAT